MRSVVICAYTMDRWTLLQRAVASAESQHGDGPVDVVVVIDHNDELLRRSAAEWPQHCVIANRFGRGLSGARNTGIDAAAGEIIAFLDDDAEAEPGWLAALASTFDDPAVGGVGGMVVPNWSTAPPEWFPPEFGWVVGCSYTGQADGVVEIRNPIGANMAFRRDVFERVGGFREEVGRIGSLPLGCEETELSIRARRAGWTIWYRPDAVVHHVVPEGRTSFAYFVRRCFAEGMSKSVVSAMAGHEAGLSSERTYVSRTLPAGIGRALRRTGDRAGRGHGLAEAGAIVLGVMAAIAGFCRGVVATRGNGPDLKPAPELMPRVESSG